MDFTLSKNVAIGERVNLSKMNIGITRFLVGLNWDIKPGLDVDLDLSVVLLDNNGKKIPGAYKGGPACFCFYGNLECEGVTSAGDDTDGSGDVETTTGMDEEIVIEIDKLNADVREVVIVCSSHSEAPESQPDNIIPGAPIMMGRVAKPKVTLFNGTKVDAPIALYTCELGDEDEMSASTAVEVAKIYKKDDGDFGYVSTLASRGKHPLGLQGVVEHFNIG